MDKKQICRIIFIGESEVGKTSLINSILGEQFNQEHITTIGIVNTLKEKIIKNKILLINLYDTAGQEKFRSLTKLTYNKKDIVIFVYDVTKIESYNAIKDYWIEEVKDNANDLKGIKIIFFIIFSYWNFW
jgi:small GTP-binding protein